LSARKLYAALKEREYPDLPHERTVFRWCSGATPPVAVQKEVREMLGLPDAPKSPPAWAEGLVRMTVAEVLDGPAIDAWIARVEALRAQRLRDRDEDQASDDPPGAGGASVPLADP